MRFVSINEFSQMLDPRARQAAEDSYMRRCIAQAKLEQDERHHYEKMSWEREKVDATVQASRIQAESAREMETIKHGNELGLANRNHILGIAGKSSALIDEMAMSVLRQDEEWNRTFADTFRTVVTKEADLISQERLRKLDQSHLVQKMRLESSLRMAELILAHELSNAKLVFDKKCDLIFKIVERALGLDDRDLDPATMQEWVREAMAQNGV